ncbi:helix-turn-helix transcriptional regulator [Clostridium sp. 'White wine YQ']|uniref:helix-turn-helix transcriptional regulator n=1 Tax=Clostridium sp. 'White wine YQ' TaxID=3027474 RepID=UPI0023661894|nr:YafY family protein [Clostridium sp. 'White wine YQ']MDD7795345.1 YafY family protein [Clostridium sp. 'White wine YQ']
MKIDRLISIVMILLERKKISATKLAEMFEVTPRTIYRDIETINIAGIPIVTYPGVNGGIGIMEQYKIEKKLFTISDIQALLIGLGNIHSSIKSEDILNTIAKVKGLIPEEQISDIELKSNQISIDHSPWFGNKKVTLNVEEVKTALNENRLVSFEYSDQEGEKSKRKVEPYRLILKNSNWYLQCYCTTREDFRIFRLSRVSSLEVLEETFIPREFDYRPLEVSKDVEKMYITIKLLIDKSLVNLMKDFAGEENVKPSGDNKFTVYLKFIEDDYWYNMLLRMGDKCECLEPEHVRLELIRRIKNMLRVYELN